MRRFFLLFIYSFVLRNFLKIVVGVKFDNARFLLKEDQFIIVANHNSHLDAMTIMASLPPKLLVKVRPVAAADHFGKTKLKEKLTNYFVNTLLIQRKRDKENLENDPINKMIQALDDGYSLIIFPEGTRGEPEVQQPIKPGIGLVLSERPNIKYVPAYMKGMGKAMPRTDNLIIPHTSYLRYGTSKYVESADVTAIMNEIEQGIYSLRDN